jgi:hypothetical protein
MAAAPRATVKRLPHPRPLAIRNKHLMLRQCGHTSRTFRQPYGNGIPDCSVRRNASLLPWQAPAQTIQLANKKTDSLLFVSRRKFPNGLDSSLRIGCDTTCQPINEVPVNVFRQQCEVTKTIQVCKQAWERLAFVCGGIKHEFVLGVGFVSIPPPGRVNTFYHKR